MILPPTRRKMVRLNDPPMRVMHARPSQRRHLQFDRLEERKVLATTATSISLAVSSSTLSYGQTQTLTATVVASGGAVSEGTVTFLDGGTAIGTGDVAGGTASFSTTGLTVGTHNLTAQYGGSSNYATSATGVEPTSTSTTVASAGLSNPTGIAVDGLGNVFIADTANSRVLKITPGGVQTNLGSGLIQPTGIAADGSGGVYVADTANNRLVYITAGGVQTDLVTGLNSPAGIAVDRGGNIYIAESSTNQVLRYSKGVTTTFASGLNNPSGVAVDGDGSVYIVDRGNNQILRITVDNQQTTVATGLNSPSVVAAPGVGTVFVAGIDGNRVVRIGADGEQTDIVSGTGQTQGIAVDGAGDVFFTGSDNRVTKLAAGVPVTVTPGVPTGSPQTVNVAHNPPQGQNISLSGSDPSVPSQPLTYQLISGPAHGLLVGTATQRDRTYVPYTNFYGTDSFTYTVSNGVNTSAPITVTLLVAPAAPVAFDQPVLITQDPVVSLTLTGSDPNQPALPLTYALVAGQGPAHGTITNFDPATGRLTYTPNASFTGSDQFAFTVSNGSETSASAQVSITSAAIRLGVKVDPRSDLVVGAPITLIVQALDVLGNVDATYNGSAELDNADGTIGNVTLADGAGVFRYTPITPGSKTIAASSTKANFPLNGSTTITVAPYAAKVRLDVQATSAVVGGAGIVYVTAFDAYGNVVRNDSGAIRLTSSDPAAVLPADPRLTNGIGTFTIVPGTAGPQLIQAVSTDGSGLQGSASILATPDIRGLVYLARDAYPAQYTFETRLADRFVYLDRNGNGKFDDGEPSTVTAADGTFSFPSWPAGSVPVLEDTSRDASLRIAVDQTTTRPDGLVAIGVTPYSPIAPVPITLNPSLVSRTDADAAYVQALYRAVLGRDGADAEINAWAGALKQGVTRAKVSAAILNSDEHRRDQVTEYYRTFLNRGLDPGAQHWIDQLQGGASETEVVAAILDSPEYQGLHPDTASFVTGLYRDVLGRNADPTGLAETTAALTQANPVSRAAVVASFVGSDEAIDQILDGLYSSYFRRARDLYSSYWATQLGRGDSVTDVAISLLSSKEFQDSVGQPPRIGG